MKPGALFSVSVDLDGLGCYAAIHGSDPRSLSERAMRAVPEVALTRLCELFAAQSLRATFFSIGQELSIPMAKETLSAAHAAGHEIASHSFAHDYALSRRKQAEIEVDLQLAEEAIEAATGRRPRGFRAPGYTLSTALVAALRARGYAYDSSLLPSPPYYLAKALAIGMHALRGKKSHSILGNIGQLFGPRAAHEMNGLRELPISTIPIVGMPIIGTVVTAVSENVAAFLSEHAFADGHFNLELHGIDVLDESDTDLPALVGMQPGLNVPAKTKLQRLSSLFGRLRSQAQSCTLEEASTRMFPA